MLDLLRSWYERAGRGPKDSDGGHEFIDDHEEAHVVGLGLGIGFTAVYTESPEHLTTVAGAAFATTPGEEGGKLRKVLSPKLAVDVKRELHYFFASIVVGAILGLIAKKLTG